MISQNCPYCRKGELMKKIAYPVCSMKNGNLYLFNEQSKPGRCIFAGNRHVSELIELTDEERDAYFKELAIVAQTLHMIFHPDKINYGAYGDTGCHFHIHLVPKYKAGDEWGSTFAMNPDKKYLTDVEYEALAEKIREALPYWEKLDL